MSLQLLFDHLDDLIRTPEHVALLEAAILQLAVRGKLTRQEEDDEPAQQVLEQIAQLKATATAGQNRISSHPKARYNSEAIEQYLLPHGWLWTTLEQVTISRDADRIPLSRDVREGRKGSYDYYGASGVIDKMVKYNCHFPMTHQISDPNGCQAF